jgi:hypothetical protein
MLQFVIVSVISGFLFAVLDIVINVNPLARRLFEVYKPIARTAANPIAGIIIDLVYGLMMAIIFLLLYNSLPGATGLIKGLSYAGIMWFFRVIMNNTSQWMMFKLPANTIFFSIASGLGEMLILGVLYGLTLKPGLIPLIS